MLLENSILSVAAFEHADARISIVAASIVGRAVVVARRRVSVERMNFILDRGGCYGFLNE